MEKKCLILTGGDFPQRSVIDCYIRPDVVIAADSGLETAIKLGYDCNFAIGDFDSLDPLILKQFPNEKQIRWPAEKEFTDTELALQLALKEQCAFRVIAGGGGGRLDHLLGILAVFDRTDSPDIWISNNSVVILIKKNYTVKGVYSKTLSFFPAGPDICTMESDGLKWPLDSLVWRKGDCGISNIAIKDNVTITMKSGMLLCVQNLDQEQE